MTACASCEHPIQEGGSYALSVSDGLPRTDCPECFEGLDPDDRPEDYAWMRRRPDDYRELQVGDRFGRFTVQDPSPVIRGADSYLSVKCVDCSDTSLHKIERLILRRVRCRTCAGNR